MTRACVRVRAGGEPYALPVTHVLEVEELGDVAPVPGAPAHVLGVRNLRGMVLPVVDLAALLGLDGGGAVKRVVVAQDGDLLAGLAVEAVDDVDGLAPGEPRDGSALVPRATLVDGALVGIVDVPAALLAAAGEHLP